MTPVRHVGSDRVERLHYTAPCLIRVRTSGNLTLGTWELTVKVLGVGVRSLGHPA